MYTTRVHCRLAKLQNNKARLKQKPGSLASFASLASLASLAYSYLLHRNAFPGHGADLFYDRVRLPRPGAGHHRTGEIRITVHYTLLKTVETRRRGGRGGRGGRRGRWHDRRSGSGSGHERDDTALYHTACKRRSVPLVRRVRGAPYDLLLTLPPTQRCR